MNTVRLTDDELTLARHALQAFLKDFGHEEADTITRIRAVIAKLAETEQEPTG